ASPLHSAPPRIASVCRPHQIACTPNASTSNPFTENTYPALNQMITPGISAIAVPRHPRMFFNK
ncbi:hypothetical protein ACQUJT_17515, partial [Ralstonia pseudosolanacearum]